MYMYWSAFCQLLQRPRICWLSYVDLLMQKWRGFSSWEYSPLKEKQKLPLRLRRIAFGKWLYLETTLLELCWTPSFLQWLLLWPEEWELKNISSGGEILAKYRRLNTQERGHRGHIQEPSRRAEGKKHQAQSHHSAHQLKAILCVSFQIVHVSCSNDAPAHIFYLYLRPATHPTANCRY